MVRNYDRGTLFFNGNSSADRMTISNLSSNNVIGFRDKATAGRATIYNTRGYLTFDVDDGMGGPGVATVARIFNAGTMNVFGPTHLRVLGRLLLKPRGSLRLFLGSKITVTRDAKLNGTLYIIGVPGRQRRYVLLAAGARTGKFNSMIFGKPVAKRNPQVRYRGTEVVLLLDPLP